VKIGKRYVKEGEKMAKVNEKRKSGKAYDIGIFQDLLCDNE
jgi:hypothetical protein